MLMTDYRNSSDAETGDQFDSSSYPMRTSSQSAWTLDSIKNLMWSTTLRKVITISMFWGSLLIITVALVYSAGKNSSGGSSTGWIAGGVAATTYVGDFKYYPGSPDENPVSMPTNLTIGFVADTALTEDTGDLYAMMKKEGVEILVVSGDLDYIDNPEGWDRLITNQLGEGFPMLVTAGNHDYAIWPRYQNFIVNRWQRANINYCNGIVGFAHTCTYKGVTIVQITPGVFNETNGIYKDVAGIGDFDFVRYIRESFAKYPNKWKVCSWHKNQNMMQTGQKKDETGWGVYNECMRQGAMIMTGHEHSYERTYLMTDLEKQTVAPGNIKDNLAISRTKGFVVVQGLGGRGIRPNYNPGNGQWAVTDNTNTSATFSGTVCKYNLNGKPNQAYCYTKDLRSKIIDGFQITLGSS